MKGMKIIEGALDTLQFFFIFLLTVRRIRMFFSLKPSQSQGESSLKMSARWGSPFRRSQGTNKQTHSLTDRLVLLQRDFESAIFYNQYVRSIYVNEYQYKPVSDTQTYVTYASTTLNSFNSVSDTQTSKNYIL